jgi:hypothetical protein
MSGSWQPSPFLTYVKAGLPSFDDTKLYIPPLDSLPSKHLKREFGDLRRELHFDGTRTWVLVEVDESTELNINNLVKFWILLIHQPDHELVKDTKIRLVHLYQTITEYHQGTNAFTWRFLSSRMKQELGDRFDADLFPVRFRSERQDSDFEQAKTAIEYALRYGTLPPATRDLWGLDIYL